MRQPKKIQCFKYSTDEERIELLETVPIRDLDRLKNVMKFVYLCECDVLNTAIKERQKIVTE